tara:strand:- start:33 stop:1004 length:972 start_codon:yes stop_codon:yes gene_type:complete
MNLLEVKNINVKFNTPDGIVQAVNNINFNLKGGESLAIVGESGSGKTQLAFSIMGLLAKNGSAIGSVKFQSKEILNLNETELNKIRSNNISMIFQDPMTSLNPYMRISDQLNEVIIHHKGASKKEALKESIQMLDAVKIPDAKNRIHMFPHEFSGGMRQRVMIAMSLLCKPDLIIADEPTTALDVTVQAQIIKLFTEIQQELHTTFILITHNMGIVAGMCDQTLVMYGGRIMEHGKTENIFLKPSHPYTKGLLEAMPRIDVETNILKTIPGNPPNMMNLPQGCPFSNRCEYKISSCSATMPKLESKTSDKHKRACFVPSEHVK